MLAILALFLIHGAHSYELLAEVNNLPAECKLGDNVQFWVNTASDVSGMILDISNNKLTPDSLVVAGTSTFQGESDFQSTVKIGHVIEKNDGGAGSEFQKQTRFYRGIKVDCNAATGACTFTGPVSFSQDISVVGQNLNARLTAIEKRLTDAGL